MPNNIEKLRELRAAGTQGRVVSNSHFGCLHTHSNLAKLHPVVHYSHNNPNMENDARLIEAALNLLPALLAVAEAAELCRFLKKRDPHGADYQNNAMLSSATDKLDDNLQKLNEVKIS